VLSSIKHVAQFLLLICYLGTHGIYATGLMPASLVDGGFQLCHQNPGTKQLLDYLGDKQSNHHHTAHHASKDEHASYISAESGCDIGLTLGDLALTTFGLSAPTLTDDFQAHFPVTLRAALASLTRTQVFQRGPPQSFLKTPYN